jgi:gliding motility-associated-like protein
VVIPASPSTPSSPLIGIITQPRFGNPTGSVVVNGLPATGTWTLTRLPGNTTVTGTGTTTTVTELPQGIYSFTVTNSLGCTSVASASFQIIEVGGPPQVVITDPAPVCAPATVNITLPAVTAGSSPDLIYTYWLDEAATRPFTTPGAAVSGTYYIKGTTSDGAFTIRPVFVSVYEVPAANAGADQNLPYVFETRMNAILENEYEEGVWSIITGRGNLSDNTDAMTEVTDLALGKNVFFWTVTNGVCPPAVDSVNINVGDYGTQTLITPNMDGKNDYFILKTSGLTVKMELIIFDRRGYQVYKNPDYDNSWNGVNFDGNPLPDDTYFYVANNSDGTSLKGFIVIRTMK